MYLVPPTVSYNTYQNDIFKAIDTLDMALFLRSLETTNINEVDEKTGNTPLHAACAQSANENFAINLINDPRVIVTIKNIDGNPPLLILAKQFNNPNFQVILDKLLEKGANINDKNNQGETVIHRAVFNKTIRNTLIRCLAEKGVNINAVTKDRMTALHYAVQVKKVDTVMHLIGCGINWDIENSHGESAMDMAIEEDNIPIVQAIRDSIDLVEYLNELGLSDFKETFIEKRMFKYSLKNIRKYMLNELGIKDSDAVKRCMESFPKITDPDRSAVYLALSDTSTSDIDNSGVMITEDELTLAEELGEGSFAKVYRGIYKPKDTSQKTDSANGDSAKEGMDVAIKVITVSQAAKNKAQLAQKVEEAREEYAITCAVNSPNILKMIGWADSVGPTKAPAIVMELCENKSLYDYLKSDVKISWAQALAMFKEIAMGLNAIHTHVPQIIHRDLKSLNILVTSDVHMKLCDFGLARFNVEKSSESLRKAKGTFRYMPPEVLGLQSVATAKSDIFALGIIFWEITYRTITKTYQLPYDEFGKVSDANLIEMINNKMHPNVPKATHPQIVNNFFFSQNDDITSLFFYSVILCIRA